MGNDRLLNQTAVYWGNPTPNGYGSYTYSSPVEINCRWESSNVVVKGKDGTEITSRAKVFVNQDLDEDGLLFLGDLDDLDSAQEEDPTGIDSIYRIIMFSKIPSITLREYERKVYLQ